MHFPEWTNLSPGREEKYEASFAVYSLADVAM